MTKVHKVVLLIVDHDDLGADDVVVEIQNVRYPNRCLSPEVMEIETTEVDWDDNHPLNSSATAKGEFERIFYVKS